MNSLITVFFHCHDASQLEVKKTQAWNRNTPPVFIEKEAPAIFIVTTVFLRKNDEGLIMIRELFLKFGITSINNKV